MEVTTVLNNNNSNNNNSNNPKTTLHYLHPDFDFQTEKARPSPLALLAETCKNICNITKDSNNNNIIKDNTINSSTDKPKSPSSTVKISSHTSSSHLKRTYNEAISASSPSHSSSFDDSLSDHNNNNNNNNNSANTNNNIPRHSPIIRNKRVRKSLVDERTSKYTKSFKTDNNLNITNNSNIINNNNNNNSNSLSVSILHCLTELFKQTNPELEKMDSNELLIRLSHQLLTNNNNTDCSKKSRQFDVASGYHLDHSNDNDISNTYQQHQNNNNNNKNSNINSNSNNTNNITGSITTSAISSTNHKSNNTNAIFNKSTTSSSSPTNSSNNSSIKYCMYCGKFIPFLPALLAHIQSDHYPSPIGSQLNDSTPTSFCSFPLQHQHQHQHHQPSSSSASPTSSPILLTDFIKNLYTSPLHHQSPVAPPKAGYFLNSPHHFSDPNFPIQNGSLSTIPSFVKEYFTESLNEINNLIC